MATVNLQLSEKQNSLWKTFNESKILTLPIYTHLKKDTKVFAMGSCFAVEIREALIKAGIDVYPKYKEIPIDKSEFIIGNLPERDNINYYHTFAIRQEFERYHSIWSQKQEDHWQVPDSFWKIPQDKVYQDPYRRTVLGKTPEALQKATDLVTKCTQQGMESADLFLITLGLIEVWKKKDNGLVACEYPGYNAGGGHTETEFHLSSFQENYDNIKETVRLIKLINPAATIVFTVSPVALGKTFTDNDVVTANTESKSLLRTAAAQVVREEENVFYFPSFEIANTLGEATFKESGRHVKEDVVFAITTIFMQSHSSREVGVR